MEILGLVDIPIWAVVLILLVLSICIYTRYKQTYFTRNGYVQKSTVFLFGDLIELVNKGLGYIDANMVKKYGKVFGTYLGNKPFLNVYDADMIKAIYVKDFSNFTERGKFFPLDKKWEAAITEAEGSHWKFLRSTISPTFSSGKMRQMQPYLKRCLDQFREILEEKRAEGQDFDIVPVIRGYTMDVICSTGFGLDVNSQRDPDNLFLKYAKEVVDFTGPKSLSFLALLFFPDLPILHKILGPTEPISKKAWDFFNKATISAFEDRKQSGSTHKDLLQLMIYAHKDKPEEKTGDTEESQLTMEDFKKRGLTDEEILMNSLIFMVAGFETTATTLSWLVYDMMVHQDVQAKLRDEIDSEIGQDVPSYDKVFKMPYLDMVVTETLRYHPPVPRLSRVATKDTEICGVKIPKDLMLAFNPLIQHFMEEYWEEPNEYRPERFAPENKGNINEYAYMPFGLGPRNCVGMRLALLEVKMTLAGILQKYIIHKSDKLKVPMPPSTATANKPNEPVYVRLEPRQD